MIKEDRDIVANHQAYIKLVLILKTNRKCKQTPLAAVVESMLELHPVGSVTYGTLLLSRSAWFLLIDPIERQETRQTS